jgi:uncharacterized protein YndB with AHSA1/START domain
MTTLIVIAVVIAGLVAFISSRPGTFRTERSAHIDAPPEKVFPFIQDFHEWTKWSPFEKLDTDLKRSYSGAPSGKGAGYAWEGKNAGSGSMVILEATPPSKVVIQLDFMKPFEAHNTAEFTMTPETGGTRVTWAMFGPQPFMAKAMGLFMSMDKIVGGQFDEGLANLKRNAES